jgi:molybdopterin-guanine dinucleotide biosynthesis protein A
VRVSYLRCRSNGGGDELHPALCVVRRDCLPGVTAALDEGERRLTSIFNRVAGAGLWVADAAEFAADAVAALLNLNTPGDLERADAILGREGVRA